MVCINLVDLDEADVLYVVLVNCVCRGKCTYNVRDRT